MIHLYEGEPPAAFRRSHHRMTKLKEWCDLMYVIWKLNKILVDAQTKTMSDKTELERTYKVTFTGVIRDHKTSWKTQIHQTRRKLAAHRTERLWSLW